MEMPNPHAARQAVANDQYILTLDIETAPLPDRLLGESLRGRMEHEIRHNEGKNDPRRFCGSMHPMLGWICAFGLCASRRGAEKYEVMSASFTEPEGEADVLDTLVSCIEEFVTGFGDQSVSWATFNGVAFDMPWCMWRMARHETGWPHHVFLPDKHDCICHKDFATFSDHWYSLSDTMEHMGVERRDDGLTDGSDIHHLVEEGDKKSIQAYAEADAIAVMDLWRTLVAGLSANAR